MPSAVSVPRPGSSLICGLSHITLSVPQGSLPLAKRFFAGVLGLVPAPVPAGREKLLVWFNVDAGIQLHVLQDLPVAGESLRHICFRVPDLAALEATQRQLSDLHAQGGDIAPLSVEELSIDEESESGQGFPTRFFARDFANNLLEFSL